MARRSFLVEATPNMWSHIAAGRIHLVSETPRGKDNWKPVPGLQESLPSSAVTFVDLNLCPFAAINRKCECSNCSEFYEPR